MSEEIIDDSGIGCDKTFHYSDAEEDTTRISICSVSSKAPAQSFRILLVKEAAHDAELVKACQSFKVPISIVEDFESERSSDTLSVYVVTSFDGVSRHGSGYRIVGRSALLEIAKKHEDSKSNNYAPSFASLPKPLYCHALSGKVICFAGFKKMEEQEMLSLKSLVNFMGGHVRNEMNANTTHLVARLYKREKFSYAMLFNVPIVSDMWVQDAWQRRDIVGFDASDPDFMAKYRLKIFFGSKICFLGFPEEEKNHMIEVLKENGGEPVDLTDATCTHMVMDDSSTPVRVSFIKHPSSLIPESLSRICAAQETTITPVPASSCSDLSPVIPLKKSKSTYADDKENHPNLVRDLSTTTTTPRRREFRRKSKKCLQALKAGGKPDENVLLGMKSDDEDVLMSEESAYDSNAVVESTRNEVVDTPENDTNNMLVVVENDVAANESSPTLSPQPDFRLPSFIFDTPVRPMPTYSETVVDDSKIATAPLLKSNKAFVVKAEWFWSSIQYETRQNESDFKLDDASQHNTTNQSQSLTPLTFSGGSLSSTGRTRKRKILNKISIGGESSPQSAQKQRRSSVADLTRVSESSFLDYTSSSILTNDDTESITSERSKTSKRYHKCLELWQTETNYVGILRTIMTLFKAELEAMVDKKEQLLNATELKIIFGHLPPIYTTHCRMLEDLNQLIANWNEDSSIGSLISKYSNDLEKAYPPFINFFENTRDMLIKCDKTKPRFHAFLKLRQSRPECGRQSLQDLLIRPVQRLPSVNLLLNDILRNTPKNSVDYDKLEAAIKEIQNVMTYINEDKKRTEGQVALFDIFNEIEKCPADLVSSHRCFISRCEVTELSDDLSGKGNPLVLFLFSDVIEVCKKRAKAFSKENNGTASSKHGHMKSYKHVEVIPLSAIVRVIDIKETDDCHNIFALIVKRSHDTKEAEDCVFSFTITDNTIVDKSMYLRSLCNQIANIVCTTDTESYLMQLEPQQLDIDSSDVNTGSLGKAFNKFASKTRVKVGRALSFNKTPSKLRRAMSTMMSPFGSQNGLTPSSQLANLQLAALPPIPNYGDDPGTPTTAHNLRKNKSASFTMGTSLRRL